MSSHATPLATLLRATREARALTQDTAAQAVGVARSTWIRWEQGAMLPEWVEVPHIADALGLDVAAVAAVWVSSSGRAPVPATHAYGDQVAAECALAWSTLDARQLLVIRWALTAESLRLRPG